MKNRIEYIDAMRGLTMLLVVYSHVSLCGMGMSDPSSFSFNEFFTEFRMPLFFFVSGFVFFKPNIVWTLSSALGFLKRKLSVQLISPILFLGLCCFCYNSNLVDKLIYDETKFGYWFTFALLEYYILYILLRMCFKNTSSKYTETVLLIFGCILYFVCLQSVLNRLMIPEVVMSALGLVKFRFFFFFVLGIVVRNNFQYVKELLDRHTIVTGSLIIYIISNMILVYMGIFSLTPLLRFLTSFSGVIIVFSYFREKRHLFTKDTHTGRVLQYVGTRTLDIYLLHYLFVYSNIGVIFPKFGNLHSPLMEFVYSLTLSVVIVAICLVISSIIRLSPTLGHYLFGQKIKQ